MLIKLCCSICGRIKDIASSNPKSTDFVFRGCRSLFVAYIVLAFTRHVCKMYENAFLAQRRDGVVVRASASQSVDLGFIPLVESYQKTLKMVFTASLLGARHLGEVVENKPASSLVVSLGKALNGTPHLYVEDR